MSTFSIRSWVHFNGTGKWIFAFISNSTRSFEANFLFFPTVRNYDVDSCDSCFSGISRRMQSQERQSVARDQQLAQRRGDGYGGPPSGGDNDEDNQQTTGGGLVVAEGSFQRLILLSSLLVTAVWRIMEL